MQSTTQAQTAGTYRYRVTDMNASSQRYGACEVCGERVNDVFLQTEEQAYARAADEGGGIGWTQHECNSFFGHEACLLGARRS